MNKTLVIISLIALALIWKFVLFPEKLDFTDSVKVLQGLTMSSAYKQAIANYHKEEKVLPTAEQWKLKGAKVTVDLGKSIVSEIKIAEIAPGSITVYYSNARDQTIDPAISGKSLSLTPAVYNGKLDWSCKGNVPVDYLPRPCR
jgi:pilin